MPFPDFLVIGAAKSGTVSLYHYLRQHPQIFMCPINEPNFFALDGFDLETHFQGPGDRVTLQRHCVRERLSYEALFTAARPDQKIGESSPLYLYSAHAPQRIRQYAPDVRLIALLRHPADRAFANYRHYRIAGLEPLPYFDQALAAEPVRLAAGWGPWPFWAYRDAGNYAEQLQRYYDRFPSEQILVCYYEELRDAPVALLQNIYRFIGLRDDFTPDTTVRHNIGNRPRSDTLHRLMSHPNILKQTIKKALPDPLRRWLRDSLQRLNEERLELDGVQRQQLVQYYEPGIRRLQNLTGHDLNRWLDL